MQRIDPAVVVQILDKARSESFGARPERHLIDAFLGGAFAEAAAASVSGPLEVRGGPSYECVPLHRDSRGDSAEDGDAEGEEQESE